MPGGSINNDDHFYYLAVFGASGAAADLTTGATSGVAGYGVPNGTVNNDDYFYYLTLFDTARAGGEGTLSAHDDTDYYANRVGYGGYLWDRHAGLYHVRNRDFDPQLGAWTRRDPLGIIRIVVESRARTAHVGWWRFGFGSAMMRAGTEADACRSRRGAGATSSGWWPWRARSRTPSRRTGTSRPRTPAGASRPRTSRRCWPAAAASCSAGPTPTATAGSTRCARRTARAAPPPSLARQREGELRARLDAGPRPGDKVCTLRGRDVQRILEREFGVRYTLDGIYPLLNRLGYSCLAPRPRHENHDSATQQKFRDEVAPLF